MIVHGSHPAPLCVSPLCGRDPCEAVQSSTKGSDALLFVTTCTPRTHKTGEEFVSYRHSDTHGHRYTETTVSNCLTMSFHIRFTLL